MNLKEIAPLVLRLSLALVFIYFGISQAINPSNWSGFVPDFVLFSVISANNVVVLNAFLEIFLGIFLLIGLYTRVASLILAVHLFGITLSIGFTPLGVRDFGLAFATLALFFFGYDKYCLDYKFDKKKKN